MVEKSNQELKKKLQEEERERKSAAAALESAKKQAKDQRIRLHSTEDQLAISKTQIAALKKKLEEAEKARELVEKARDQAEQDGYDLGVAKAEETLRKVSGVRRTYSSQVWFEALNQAGVKASSVLRRADRVYYAPAIREFGLSGSRIDTPSEVAEVGKDSIVTIPSSSVKHGEEAKHLEVIEKDKDAN